MVISRTARSIVVEYALDDTGSLWCFCMATNRPCTDLIGPTGEVMDELRRPSVKTCVRGQVIAHIKTGVTGVCDLAKGTMCADLLLFLSLFFLSHTRQTFFEGY